MNSLSTGPQSSRKEDRNPPQLIPKRKREAKSTYSMISKKGSRMKIAERRRFSRRSLPKCLVIQKSTLALTNWVF